jgi:hypothetical protein
MSSFYRGLPIGVSLISALNELIEENKLTPQQAGVILVIF